MTERKNKFSAELSLTHIDRWNRVIDKPFTFYDEVEGPITVPAGFYTDLASVLILREIAKWAFVAGMGSLAVFVLMPWIFAVLAVVCFCMTGFYAIVAGYGPQAAALHDFLYRTPSINITRKRADAVFYRALHHGEGIAEWRSKGMWAGVRAGGKSSFVERNHVS